MTFLTKKIKKNIFKLSKAQKIQIKQATYKQILQEYL